MDSSFRTFKREEALSDMHQLLRILTEAHPDPFRNLGSQVKFYTKVEEILSSLEETIDLSQLNMIVMRIIALLGDCHTQATQLFAKSGKVWLEFKPIDKMIILTGVYENKFSSLIGHKLLAVNGIPVEELISKMLEIRAANGIYNKLLVLSYALKETYFISLLTGKSTGDMKEIIFTLISLEDNSIHEIAIPNDNIFEQKPPGKLIEHDSLHFSFSSKSDISYKIIEDMIGYLRIDSMTKYRESYESLLKSGASESFLREMFGDAGFELHGEIDKILSEVPSASEAIVDLLQKMHARGVKDLIVDLTNNTGGNSYLDNILTYFLYGDKVTEIDKGYDIERHSSWYKKQYNPGENEENLDGYTFAEMHKWVSGKRGMSAEEWKREVNLSSTFAEYVEKYKLIVGINVYVLCSPLTFNAGFDLLDMLKRCGATIIGIPPSQPANAFTNVIGFSLDNSGIKGQVSTKLMLKYPDKEIFYNVEPDIIIGIESFKKNRWDKNTILLETLEMIGRGKHNRGR